MAASEPAHAQRGQKKTFLTQESSAPRECMPRSIAAGASRQGAQSQAQRASPGREGGGRKLRDQACMVSAPGRKERQETDR
jgi:hypothetical protein